MWGVSVDMLCVGFARGAALWPNVHFGFICPQDIVPEEVCSDANLSHAAMFLLGKEKKIAFQALLIQLFLNHVVMNFNMLTEAWQPDDVLIHKTWT